ncbi:hypothetical protein FKM82_025899 [Ascaphus truei]
MGAGDAPSCPRFRPRFSPVPRQRARRVMGAGDAPSCPRFPPVPRQRARRVMGAGDAPSCPRFPPVPRQRPRRVMGAGEAPSCGSGAGDGRGSMVVLVAACVSDSSFTRKTSESPLTQKTGREHIPSNL